MKLRDFADETVARLERTTPSADFVARAESPCSHYSGAAGLAFFFHEAARWLGRPELLDTSARWCDVAESLVSRARSRTWQRAESFLDGRAGVAHARILTSSALGDVAGVTRGLAGLERAAEALPSAPPALFEGAAGLVCASADLLARLPNSDAASRARLHRVGDAAFAQLRPWLSVPLARRGECLVGIAHGLAGELWAALVWRGTVDARVERRAAELASLAQRYDTALVWPHRVGEPLGAPSTWWCHGVTGHVMLWTTLSSHLRDRASARRARLAATATFARPAPTPTLCCGLAGQALALQRYARAQGEGRFARRSLVRLHEAIAACRAGDASLDPVGLWQGAAGVALVAMMRLAGEAFFPGIESPS